ncbi:MAG TPA: DUF692 family protein [Nitrospirales bacterium]|nr:DUF692 family protein [Nitrospirales bacterium]
MRYTDLSRGEAIYEDFLRRAGRIPFLGLGLSVDVYSPDIFDLYEELRSQQIPMAYLEIFHAASEALAMVRARLSDIPLAYHAEGIWVTQPDWDTAYNSQERLQATAFNLRMLQPHWVNQECAAKEIGGFSFGTYLPPVFTRASAEITAYQTWNAQLQLDQFDWGQQVSSPLLLLEVPPLTYFSMGEMPYAEFFANISAKSPCGLVLDLGHVWTVYRYSGAWRKQGLESFFEAFLEQFPLERVIEIHIAGLDCHPNIHTGLDAEPHGPQNWIDAHEAPIPDELLMLLTRVLGDSRLLNLKGIALEVDNKPIPLICREMKMVMEMVEPPGHLIAQVRSSATELQRELNFPVENVEPSRETRDGLTLQYREYMALVREVLSGRLDVPGSLDAEMNMGLHVYATQYLPYEILTWGGDVRVMFPNACDLLAQYGISLKQFVEFWFAHPRTAESGIEYDFFLLKIDLFVKFIGQKFPEASSLVQQEAELLIQGYLLASQGAST